MHLELFVEEPSAEAALAILVPRIVGPEITFRIYPHQGKTDLLHKLPARLRGYRSWLPADWRIGFPRGAGTPGRSRALKTQRPGVAPGP